MHCLIMYLVGVVFAYIIGIELVKYEGKIQLTKYHYIAMGILSLLTWILFFIEVGYFIAVYIKKRRNKKFFKNISKNNSSNH